MKSAVWRRAGTALRSADPILLAGCAVTLAFVASVATMTFEFGSREAGWVFPYYRSTPWSGLATFALTLCCALPLLAWSTWRVGRHETLCIATWLIAGSLLQLVLRISYPIEFDEIVRSNVANSYYSASLGRTYGELLRDFDSITPTLPLHARGNMPGKIGLFALLGLFTSSPQAMGVVILLISNLAALCGYWIARELGADRRAALFSLVLMLFIPGKVAFLPLLNVVAPIWILLGFLLLLRFLRTTEGWVAMLLGADVYATAFFDPLPLSMAPLFALFIGGAMLQRRLDAAGISRLFGLAALGFAFVYAFVWAVFGFDLFGALLYVFEDARRFNALANRPYSDWAILNLIEFGTSLGVCGAVVWLGDMVRTHVGHENAAIRLRSRLLAPMTLLSLGCIATLLILDLSGTSRGEVTRLWIYLASFVQIPLASVCARRPGLQAVALVLACALLQDAVTISMVAFVIP